MEPDLMSAVVAYLRATPSVVSAFGEDTSQRTLTKFWADQVPPGVVLPWAFYEEMDEPREPVSIDGNSDINYFCRGRFRFNVSADSKYVARQLGDLVGNTLSDPPLTFSDGVLLELRFEDPFWETVVNPVDGSVIGYLRVITFLYMVQRVLPANFSP